MAQIIWSKLAMKDVEGMHDFINNFVYYIQFLPII